MPTNPKIIDCTFLKNNIKQFRKKNTIILTGAGISVNSGIPDFRSKTGIFSEIKDKLKVKGTDFFSYRFTLDPNTRPLYYKFISQLKLKINECKPSKTHFFLNTFKHNCKKFRTYTQNIDLLEERSGLKFSKDNDTELVYLHGDLKCVKCFVCGYRLKFDKNIILEYQNGNDILCPKCININLKKNKLGLRKGRIGYMNTNIIHYEQNHPDDYFISNMFGKDMKYVNLFIVIGTSLKVYGVKNLVKSGLRSCINNNGKSVFVGLELPSKEFRDLFDYFWIGDCDDFSCKLKDALEIEDLNESIANISLLDDFSRLSSVKGSFFKGSYSNSFSCTKEDIKNMYLEDKCKRNNEKLKEKEVFKNKNSEIDADKKFGVRSLQKSENINKNNTIDIDKIEFSKISVGNDKNGIHTHSEFYDISQISIHLENYEILEKDVNIETENKKIDQEKMKIKNYNKDKDKQSDNLYVDKNNDNLENEENIKKIRKLRPKLGNKRNYKKNKRKNKDK